MRLRLGWFIVVAILATPAAYGQFLEKFVTSIGNLVEGAAPCAGAAALLAKLTNNDDKVDVVAIGAGAACAAAALVLEHQRQAAIEAETELDRQIRDQAIQNRLLSEKNEELRRELDSVREKARRLRERKYQNQVEALKLAQEIESSSLAATERLAIVRTRLRLLSDQAKEPNLDSARRLALREQIATLTERERMLSEIVEAGAQ